MAYFICHFIYWFILHEEIRTQNLNQHQWDHSSVSYSVTSVSQGHMFKPRWTASKDHSFTSFHIRSSVYDLFHKSFRSFIIISWKMFNINKNDDDNAKKLCSSKSLFPSGHLPMFNCTSIMTPHVYLNSQVSVSACHSNHAQSKTLQHLPLPKWQHKMIAAKIQHGVSSWQAGLSQLAESIHP